MKIQNSKFKIQNVWLIGWFVFIFCLLRISVEAKDDSSYEIIAHRARLQLFPQSNSISCTDTLTVRLKDSDGGNISFGLLPVYNIENILVNGKEHDFKRHPDHFEVEDVPSDSVVQIVVVYSGTLAFRSEFTQMSGERAVLRDDEVLPYGQKMLQSVRLSIVVPHDWEAVAVGQLTSKLYSTDTTTYVWEFHEPIPAIGWICAGKFRTTLNSVENIPISVSLFEEDSSYASKCIILSQSVLQFYGEHFSQYRFPKLAIIEVEDWVAGKNVLAIAAPSFIMVKKLAFETTDVFNQFQSILPHEIAHQWWPMTVFANDEDLALLSEGMCEYSALMYAEASGTMSSRDSLGNHPLLRPLLMRVMKGRDLPLQQKADLRSLPTHYLKASYVHNMLRKIIGDSSFFQLYHMFAQRFSLKKTGLKEFKELAEELTDKKLGWFFEQWVMKRGVPRLKLYNVKSTAFNATWIVKGRVRLLGYDKYTTFTDVGVETSNGKLYQMSVWLGADSTGVYHNDVPFEITTASKPVRAVLDPGGDVLKLQKLPAKLRDLRDPSDGMMIVGTLHHADYLYRLAQSDSAEMDKAGWSITIKTDTKITLADLQKERVILYGKGDENRIVAEQLMKFPLGFRGDSVAINNEVLFDSTLALTQSIDNPYIAQGLMIWVAPLSELSKPELLPMDYSWVLLRGKDIISSGTWSVKDEELVVEIP